MTAYAIDAFYQNGGSSAYVLRAADPDEDEGIAVASQGSVLASSPGRWGGSVSVAFLAASGAAPDAASGSTPQRFRIAVVYESPEPGGERRLVETWDRLSLDPGDENYVVDVLRRSLFIRWDETLPLEAPQLDALGSTPSNPTQRDIVDGATELTGGFGGGGELGPVDYGQLLADRLADVDDAALLVATCDALLADDADYGQYVDQFIGFAENRPRRDLFFIGDLPRQSDAVDPTSATQGALAGLTELNASNFTALYWPHVVAGDIVGAGRNPTITLPPSAFVAGLYARTDGRRGVWKAPAGTEATLNGTIALEHRLNDLHSDDLNPVGINALRLIPGAGRVVWGTRTMVPASEWRYVPVRRMAIFLRTSIYNGIQWAVFEPNDEPLWSSLRASINAFLESQFRNGAFAGRTSDEAYGVKVDADTTTELDQAAGVVNILVSFAPLRPAEFVVVHLSQKTQSA
ncbi:hypothetical protein SAMN05443668_103115 [Cryptosporangium aurantiacum]|uniref:Tail sheath protein C-terminal domain-containing protein n=1 Tax=Cryptosporangium aurantiacum TaxID=134849 RepID=A0A1M7PBK7_9ACTN|nr:hypothetical protein SAMN05443668_103115 [Cryptosporangium aurantiacum]